MKYFRELEAPLQKAMGLGNQTTLWRHVHGLNDLPESSKEGKAYIENAAEYYTTLGEYLFYARQLKQARKYLERARGFHTRLGSRKSGYLRNLALTYKMLGNGKVSIMELPIHPKEYSPLRAREYPKVAAEYARMRIQRMLKNVNRPEEIRKKYGSMLETEEYYLHSYECDNPLRYKDLAEMYLCMGDTEKTVRYLEEGGKCNLCLSCRYQECYDIILTRAYQAEFAGDREQAAKLFAEALRICPTDTECTLGAYFAAHPEAQEK